MSSGSSLNVELSKKTSFLGLKLWVLIGLGVGAFIVLILCILSVWVMFRRRSRRSLDKYSTSQIPNVSKDINVDKVGVPSSHDHPESVSIPVHDKAKCMKVKVSLASYRYSYCLQIMSNLHSRI